MANEIHARLETGLSVYALVFDGAGQVWTGSAFAGPADGNILSGTIALAEAQNTGVYRGHMPSVAAGTYTIQVYQQLGGSPHADDDLLRGEGEMHWSGTAEVGRNLLATASAVDDLPSAAEIREEIDSNSTQLAAIKTETDKIDDMDTTLTNVVGLVGDLPSAAEVAGAVLAHDVATVEDSAALDSLSYVVLASRRGRAADGDAETLEIHKTTSTPGDPQLFDTRKIPRQPGLAPVRGIEDAPE